MQDIKDKVLNWLVTGRVGLSSKAMACAACDLPVTDTYHPADPDDLNRCLLLLEKVPEIRQEMEKVAQISDSWAKLVARWDEVENLFLAEVGLNWSHGDSAPETYALMKSIGC